MLYSIGDTVKLVTWNVAGRKAKANQQVAFISKSKADVLALQEVTITTLPILRRKLEALGYKNVISSFDLAPDHSILVGPRRYGQLIASIYPLDPIEPEKFDIPWTERILTVEAKFSADTVRIHTTHVPPGSSNKWIKIETFEGIFEGLRREPLSPRILCGDFNSPQNEFSDGRVQAFGQRVNRDGAIVNENQKGHPPGRWARGELSVITGLGVAGMNDAYRRLNGYQSEEFSWFHSAHKGRGRRFDHIFASESLEVIECNYLHEARTTRLSDHSALEAVFKIDN